MKAKGQTILVVDQYVHKLVGLASHHVILERGRVVRSDDSAALNADRRLRTDYEGFKAVLEDKRPFLGIKSGYKPIDTCASSY